MLKIHQLFIIKFLLLFVGTLFVTSLISYVALKSTIIDNNKKHLQNAISLIGSQLQSIDNLDSYALSVNENTAHRVTMIDADGVVVAESSADKSTMDNHAARYEIMQANQDEFSHVVRYSKTLKVDFLYVAKNTSIRIKIFI